MFTIEDISLLQMTTLFNKLWPIALKNSTFSINEMNVEFLEVSRSYIEKIIT